MITGCVLARNEQHNIEACLRSLRPFVQQLILLDMESDDATVDVAQPLVDLVVQVPLVDDIDAARNLANQYAVQPWLWFVDADERIPKATGQMVTAWVQKLPQEVSALQIPFRTYFAGKWIEHSGWWPGYTAPRVLRKDRFEFRDGVHRGVSVDGQIVLTPADPNLAIDHFSYRDIAHYFEKFNRYTSIEARGLADRTASFQWSDGIRSMVQDLWQYYEAGQGHRDGVHGWILAWLAGQYRWATHAKWLDQSQRAQHPAGSIPESLDAVLDVMTRHLAELRASGEIVDRLGVVLRSPIWDPSGYADDGRHLALSLAHLDRELAVEEIRWSESTTSLPAGHRVLLRSLAQARLPRQFVAITNCIATLVEPDPRASINVLRTTFETDRIPRQWLERLDAYDEVWVFSEQNRRAFLRGGVASERLRCVPSGYDPQVFSARGLAHPLPSSLQGRFVFLSLFDWQHRKGWDVLIRAYLNAFGPEDRVGLLLKITSDHRPSKEQVQIELARWLDAEGLSFEGHSVLEVMVDALSTEELASLYRAVDAFALPTRGEGWGRPLMEAMASGLPVIASRGSGNEAFMNDGNSLLVETRWSGVPEYAAREIPVYEGHRWLEPDVDDLSRKLRLVYSDAAHRARLGQQAQDDMKRRFSLTATVGHLDQALRDLESRFQAPQLPKPSDEQLGVVLEGEFFATHSFSNINEQLAQQFAADHRLALSLDRQVHQPTCDRRTPMFCQLKPYFDRPLKRVDVTIRHCFPPNWQPPQTGKWIHIQPWEFGALPKDWIEPLCHQVDEIWLPSEYCREVYQRSGIPESKIQVIPWGIDPNVYHEGVEPLALPRDDHFRFLFVGGVIPRKGFDWVLQAFLTEFTENERVSLVIKDLGVKSFYRDSPVRDAIRAHVQSGRDPHLEYLDRDMTPGQLAGLYAACQVLVLPYRGEGFGLPVLESMACGLMPIVPKGGPTDDFTCEQSAIRLDSQLRECLHGWRLTGIGTELEIDVRELRAAMRYAFEHPEEVAKRGQHAARRARERYAWPDLASKMIERIEQVATATSAPSPNASELPSALEQRDTLSVCILHLHDDHAALAATLGSVCGWSDERVVLAICEDGQQFDPSVAQICREYEARLYGVSETQLARSPVDVQLRRCTKDWILWLESGEELSFRTFDSLGKHLCQVSPATWALRMRLHDAAGQFLDEQPRVLRNINGCDFGPDWITQPLATTTGNAARTTPISAVIQSFRPVGSISLRALATVHAESPPLVKEASGVELLREGDPFHAECLLKEALDAQPFGSPIRAKLLYQLAVASLHQGDPARMSEYWSQGRSEFPHDERFSSGPPQPLGPSRNLRSGLKLYLGAGGKSLPGYVGVDCVAGAKIEVVHDLSHRPWPWEDATVSRIVAEDLVEHLDINLVEFCDEAWRVLKPDGLLFIRTPHYQGASSWIDPTHRWHLDVQSFEFLDPSRHWGQVHPHYSQHKWTLLSLGIRGPQNIHALLRPRKSEPDLSSSRRSDQTHTSATLSRAGLPSDSS